MINITTETIEELTNIIDIVIDANARGDLTEYFTSALLLKLYSANISRENAEQILKSRFLDNKYQLEQIYDKGNTKDILEVSQLSSLQLHKTIVTDEDWKKISDDIDQIINKAVIEKTSIESYPLDSNTYLIIDHKHKTISEETKNPKNKSEENYRRTIIGAIPDNIQIHINPFVDEPNKCDIDWITVTHTLPLQMRATPMGEIQQFLKEHLLIFNQRRFQDILARLLYTKQIQNQVKIDHKIDTPGIFIYPDTGKFLIKEIDVNDSATYDEEIEALDFLDHYATFFAGQEDKLATVLKWGWVSPFTFLAKQLEYDWIPWLYLYGKAGSGKTEGYGYPVLYMYDSPVDGINTIGGAELETTPRIGKHASSGTKPILVNEPGKIFQTPSTADILKNCITSKTSRGKYMEGVRYTTIPSYASMMFTSNRSLPADESLRRRFIILNCSHSENTTQTRKKFRDEIKPSQPETTPLNHLKTISAYVLYRIQSNPELLSDWKEGIDTILHDFYTQHGREYGWLSRWKQAETNEDLIEEKKTIIREALAELIIRTFDYEIGAPIGATPMSTVLDVVIESRKIPWIDFKNKKSERLQDHEIAFSTGLVRFLQNSYQEEDSLKDIAELLGWTHSRVVKCFNGTGIFTSRDELLCFLFPSDIDYFYKERYPTQNKEVTQFYE